MAHPRGVVDEALALGGQGVPTAEIARRLRVPRRTVHDWLGAVGPPRLGAPGERCASCGQAPHRFDALPPSYLYLLGVYLGDGCISAHPRGVYRLRIFLDLRYPGIVNEVAEAMRVVMPRNAVGRRGHLGNYVKTPGRLPTSVQLSSYSRAWPCLLPHGGSGRKHERSIALSEWQQRLVERDPWPLLRGLIHSDGCRSINTGRGGWRHARYSFSNLSEDILGIFMTACDAAGLRHTTCPKTVYVSRKADVARMDEFVGPKT